MNERKYFPIGFADYCDTDGNIIDGIWRNEGTNLRSVNRLASNNYSKHAKSYRDILAEFFVSKEGWLPWQEDHVNRGGVPTQ